MQVTLAWDLRTLQRIMEKKFSIKCNYYLHKSRKIFIFYFALQLLYLKSRKTEQLYPKFKNKWKLNEKKWKKQSKKQTNKQTD